MYAGGPMASKRNGSKNKAALRVAHRVNLLFFTVFVLFTILLLRLAQMQIVEKKFYSAKLNATTNYTIKTSSVRGEIFDATGLPLVTNTTKNVIAFTRSNTITTAQIKQVAQRLATIAPLTQTSVSTRDKKDYFLATPENYQAVVARLPKNERYDNFGNSLSESTIYENAVNAVTDDEINFSEDEEKIVYIFTQMNGTSTFGSVNLTTGDLSDDQIAAIQGDTADLPGISITTDWDRTTSDSASSLADVIGTVSSSQTGLPSEDVSSYLKKGYSLNDRVGTSYLEKQYESDLQGSHTIRKIRVNRKGEVIKDVVSQQGTQGKALKLTINMAYQTGVENILSQYYNSELAAGNATYSEGIYAVALDTSTGAILAMAGLSHTPETSTTTPDALGTITDVFVPGSVVKGATITAGWANNVLTGNETLYDQPIYLSGTNVIKSWFTSGSMPITAVQALTYSSNTYMVQIALKLMGQDYTPGMTLSDSGADTAMSALRKTYAEYGMGTDTGIDLPNASTGFLSSSFTPGNVVTEAFGQYDSYTTMQLAQYAATIANGGTRLAPHLVDSIYDSNSDGSMGALSQTIATKTMNKVTIPDGDMGILQEGFYDVVHSSSSYATGTSMLGGSISISGKTGTAETFATSSSGATITTVNNNVVAYGPSDNAKIAVAVMYPHSTNSNSKASQYIARDMISLYASMYGIS